MNTAMSRTPIEISWDEMEDDIDTAQAFVTAFIMEDVELQTLMAERFIFPAIEDGNADRLMYAFATVAATLVITSSQAVDLEPIELMQVFQSIREESPLEEF